MPALQPTIEDTWASFTWKLFALFQMREGWSLVEVNEEKIFLMTAGAKPEATYEEIKNLYFPMIRKGAKRRVNRKDRVNIILSYQRACNHASIHFENA